MGNRPSRSGSKRNATGIAQAGKSKAAGSAAAQAAPASDTAAVADAAQAEQTAASGTNQQAPPLELDMDDIQAAAGKLDIFYPDKEAMRVFHLLVNLLPDDRKVELYSGLQEITLPMEELQKLPLEDQRKLINSTLLTLDNFRYIVDTILADAGAPEKGRFLLRTVDRLRNSSDVPLKRNIADEAARLPDRSPAPASRTSPLCWIEYFVKMAA